MPRLGVLIVGTVLVLTCASCSQDADGPNLGKPTTTTASPSTSPSLPSPTVPADLVKYAPEERAAYQAAVTAYDDFTTRNARFLAKGKTTKPASRFYHRYSIDWVEAWANLAQLTNNGVRVYGATTIVWVHPKRITVGTDGSADVVLRRCLDESGLVVSQGGKPLAQPQLKYPHIYRVSLARKSSEAWWRSGVARQGPRC